MIGAIRVVLVPMLLGHPAILSISEIDQEIERALALRPGVEIVDSEQLFVAAQEGLMARLRECGAAEACIANELRGLHAVRAFLLVVNDRVTPRLLSLRCVDLVRAEACGEEALELAEKPEAASEALKTALDGLLDRLAFPRLTRLDVTSNPSDASIEIAGAERALRATSNRYWLPTGRYTVTARRDGWVETSSVVQIGDPGVRQIDLSLGAKPEEEGPPWLWIGLGLSVIAAGAAAAFLVTHERDRCLCLGPKGSCPGC